LVFALAIALTVGLILTACWLWQWNRARLEWQTAQDALRRHDLAAGAACLERYLQRRPEEAPAWFLAGRTARRLGRFAEAERCLERCQELAGVTDATRLEWDLSRVQQGQLADIHVRLRMTIGPDHPDALLVLEALAQGYLKCERLLDARQACEMWLSREPDHPWPWLWRGFIFERLAHLDKAVLDYQHAVELAPEDRETRLALAGLLSRQRKSTEAADHFEYLLERFPEDEETLLGLAACRIELGNPDQAVPLLERVRTDKPVALFLRGKLALQRHDFADAERWLRQAVLSAPDSSTALYLLVQCLQAQARDAEAGQLTQRLEQLRHDLHRLDELTLSIARQPDLAAPRHEAGVLGLRIGRSEEGLRLLHSALRAKGDPGPTHAVLADYYQQKGDQARAETHRHD